MTIEDFAMNPGYSGIAAPGHAARHAGRAALAQALLAARERTLALFAAYEAALPPGLPVPLAEHLNPPRWELGHVGWFQEWWLGRNRQRALGVRADPLHARPPSLLAGADALYDSSAVAHDSRWTLPLPDADATRAYLAQVLAQSLALLPDAEENDDGLYFWRLALFHEDMHAEAAVYMAQALGLALPEELRRGQGRLPAAPQSFERQLALPGGAWRLGWDGLGFAFDNELPAHAVTLAPFQIDAAPVNWARFLPFVEAGGYGEARWWSAEGWRWRAASGREVPAVLRRTDGGWQQWCLGTWAPLDPEAPALHLSAWEAEAWCRWAGRRLPSEAEWECAACSAPGFCWGEAWEWTASAFEPFAGFAPHPYRDYSQPWFGSRRVLRGASFATAARLVHPKYRNYFPPHRGDVPAGFRSCAV